MTIRFSLVGRRSHRTPLSYSAYQRLFSNQLLEVDPARAPDLLVFGTRQDIADENLAISAAFRSNPAVKLVVLSEEPFWDMLWGGDYSRRLDSIGLESGKVEFTSLNHVTSNIYDFNSIPYYITTNDIFFARYNYFFSRNSEIDLSEIEKRWESASIKAAFFAERRLDEKYGENTSSLGMIGLSRFRSLISVNYNFPGTLKVGLGWTKKGVKRQRLPDWHLDKLSRLDRLSRIVSAVENTHFPSYITEKIFDAYAVQAIPLYFSSCSHRLKELVPNQSYINLYETDVEQAIDLIHSFSPDREYVERYIEDQRNLAYLFRNPNILRDERLRVVGEIYSEFAKLLDF